MGAGASTPVIGGPVPAGKDASYSTLLKVQERDNIIFGRIFKRMIENITPKELRELYSKPQCDKYHFALGNALKKIFYATPIRGLKSESIYWLKLDAHKKGETEEEKKQFYTNCFQVAYFYIRLLQIFCALSISTKGNESIPYSGVPFGGPMAQFVRFPGMMGGKEPLFQLFEKNVYTILQSYLNEDNIFKNARLMSFDDNTITIKRPNGDNILTAVIEYTKEGNEDKLIISNIIYNDENLDAVRKIRIVYSENEKRYKAIGKNNSKYPLDNFISEVLSSIASDYVKKKDVGKKKGTEAAAPIGQLSQERKELRVDELVQRLSGSAHKPYAVARALQLIDLIPHDSYKMVDVYGRGRRGIKAFTTNIFNFTYSPIIGNAPAILNRQQLNEISEKRNTLATVFGLRSLENLYRDDWENIDSASGYRIKPENKDEYKAFMKKIYSMYVDTTIEKVNESALNEQSDLHLFVIKEKDDGKVLDSGRKLDMTNPVHKQLAAYLKMLQSKLFGLQVYHNEQVRNFIQNKIIADTSRGPLANRKIFEIGLPYINEVGAESRRLLLRYYEEAEAIYRLGHAAAKSVGIFTM